MKARLLFALSVMGLVLSAYLLSSYLTVGVGCSDIGCQKVRDSAYSHLYGVPVPLLGVLFYAALAALQFARPWRVRSAGWIDRATLRLALVGVLFSAWLTYLEVAVVRALCPWCVTSAVLAALIALAAWAQSRKPELPDPEDPPLWTVRGLVGWGVAAGVLLGGVVSVVDYQTFDNEEAVQDQGKVYPADLLVRPDSFSIGPAKAPLRLVVFSDAQCPVCAEIVPAVVDYVGRSHNLRVTLRHFPLRSHAYSIVAGEAQEAAGAQGKFWEMEQLLFQHQHQWKPKDLPKFAGELGLDVRRFSEDIRTSKYRPKVMRDREDGWRLEVRQTPTFFLNERRLFVPLTPGDVLDVLRQRDLELIRKSAKQAAPAGH